MKILVVDNKPEDRYFLETVLKGKVTQLPLQKTGRKPLKD